MKQHEGLIDSNHPRKVCKLKRQFMDLNKHQVLGHLI